MDAISATTKFAGLLNAPRSRSQIMSSNLGSCTGYGTLTDVLCYEVVKKLVRITLDVTILKNTS